MAILPLFLFNIILPTVDIGTDALLISKLDNTSYVCNDKIYEKCNYRNEDYFSCNHTRTYEICLEDPKLFCSTISNSNSNDKGGISCGCEFHPIFASTFLFFFLLNYLISWISWARLTDVSGRWNTFIFPLFNIFPQFGEFYKFK